MKKVRWFVIAVLIALGTAMPMVSHLTLTLDLHVSITDTADGSVTPYGFGGCPSGGCMS